MQAAAIGKWLIIIGIIVAIVGGLFWLGAKFGLPIGKLPGDISVQKEKFAFYMPIATSLILSVLLTILINLFFFFFRK
jgi:magnesium-transporting ATPase (P-type)